MSNLFGYPESVVYMIQYADEPIYKIGHTSDLNRGLSRLSTLVPHSLKVEWVIYTDHPKWLESYWHDRFKSKRRAGSGVRRMSEWFNLSSGDVAEFRKYEKFNKPEEQTFSLFSDNSESKFREEAIIRVVNYYNRLISQNPHCAAKLANSCNFQINQVNAEILRMQEKSISSEPAIHIWEQRAYRAADKKI